MFTRTALAQLVSAFPFISVQADFPQLYQLYSVTDLFDISQSVRPMHRLRKVWLMEVIKCNLKGRLEKTADMGSAIEGRINAGPKRQAFEIIGVGRMVAHLSDLLLWVAEWHSPRPEGCQPVFPITSTRPADVQEFRAGRLAGHIEERRDQRSKTLIVAS